MRQSILLFFLFSTTLCYSQDTSYLQVHFLYGSKPLKKYKDTEPKWFGGVMGGHVGIEANSDSIVNFVPKGKFHWFAKPKKRHSAYAVHTTDNFYAILGGNTDSVKKAIVYVPITLEQKLTFDSITAAYLKETPYDYALFGMRCGAAAYDILGKINVLPAYGYRTTYKKIFYPKKLRKRLFKKATENNWQVVTQEGSPTRKWESD